MRKEAAPTIVVVSDKVQDSLVGTGWPDPAVEQLTELSNLARLRRPPSTILSRLISVLPICSLGLPDEDEPGALSPLL